MSDPIQRPRNWSVTYVAVMASEIVWLALLWWLGRHFGG
jgi:hypothetical protein